MNPNFKVGRRPYASGRNDFLGYGHVNACNSLMQAGAATDWDCGTVHIDPPDRDPFDPFSWPPRF